MQHVQPEINRLTAILQNSQGKDGSWHDPFETNIVVDSLYDYFTKSSRDR